MGADVFHANLYIKPFAFERPRSHGKRFFNSSRYKRNRDTAAWLLIDAKTAQRWRKTDKPVGVILHFHFKTPKKKLSHFPRIDLDNCVKAMNDAMNDIIYDDDRQIMRLQSEKIWSTEDCISVTVWEIS